MIPSGSEVLPISVAATVPEAYSGFLRLSDQAFENNSPPKSGRLGVAHAASTSVMHSCSCKGQNWWFATVISYVKFPTSCLQVALYWHSLRLCQES
eukprot:3771274-Amphidinium_carterae.1